MIVFYIVQSDLSILKGKSSGSYNRRGWVDIPII